MNSRSAGLLSFVSLIVGVIALLVAIGAYNRTGEDIQGVAQDTLDQATEEVSRGVSLINIQRKLIQVRSDIQNEDVTDVTQQLINEIEQEARELNLNANFFEDITQLEAELRQGAASTLSTLERLIDNIGTEMKTEN